MNEIILEELIGKVTDHDKALQAVREEIRTAPDHGAALQETGQRIDSMQAEIADIPNRLSFPETAVREMRQELERSNLELQRHSQQLKVPLRQEVRHYYHVTRQVWVIAGLVVVCVGLIVLLVNAWVKVGQHTEADVKYRSLKLWGSPGMVKAIRYMDSLYLADPGGMEKGVVQEEERRAAELERLRRLEEKKAEVKELEGKR